MYYLLSLPAVLYCVASPFSFDVLKPEKNRYSTNSLISPEYNVIMMRLVVRDVILDVADCGKRKPGAIDPKPL